MILTNAILTSKAEGGRLHANGVEAVGSRQGLEAKAEGKGAWWLAG